MGKIPPPIFYGEMVIEMYNVEIEYWNGGHKELVTGEPVTWDTAIEIKNALRLESRSGEFFINIIKLEEIHND